MKSGNQFGTCRYCGRQIMWIRTKARKNMPVDPQIIGYKRPEGGIKGKDILVTGDGDVVCVDKAGSQEAEGTGYISHFATCTGINRNNRRP